MTENVNKMTHVLKCDPHWFEELISGRKIFEVRDSRDRCFQAGDVLHVYVETREDADNPMLLPGRAGRQQLLEVIAVYSNVPGVQAGYVVLSVRVLVERETRDLMGEHFDRGGTR